MERELLLEAMAAAIRGRRVDWNGRVTGEDWQGLFGLARRHHVTPLVTEAVYTCPDYLALSEGTRSQVRRETARLVMGQTMRSTALTALCREMEGAGFHPLVMKGAACRSIWPLPDARISSDEDILVPGEEFLSCVQWLEGRGCIRKGAGNAPEEAFELGYNTPEGLYLELHRAPFDPRSGAFGACDPYFEGACARREFLPDGLPVMAPHDHMLYLILHAFKHLIHSGFGIRQVCDILLWAEIYGSRVDWPLLAGQCAAVRAHGFAGAVFRIGLDHFGFDPDRACLPPELMGEQAVGEALLADLLAGGVYGSADADRLHSSTVTLGAVEAQRQGKRPSLLTSLFPGRARMEGDYPYVKDHPILLPLAWTQRLLRYGRRVGKTGGTSPAESLRIGRERRELLKQLDILD